MSGAAPGAGVVMLAAGYPVAVGVLVRLRSVLRRRQWQRFVALEAATASIAGGWALRGRSSAVVVNTVALVGFAVAWWVTRGPAAPPDAGPSRSA